LKTIEDDGIGFPDSLKPGTGMGLRIMQYQAEMIGVIFGCAPKGPGGHHTCEAGTSL
jgi:nitrate/nitrite-specific signal transduction histidine kinase